MLVLKVLLFILEAVIGLGSILMTSLLVLNTGFCDGSDRTAIHLCLAWLANIALTFLAFYYSISLSWMAVILPIYAVVAIGLFTVWLFRKA